MTFFDLFINFYQVWRSRTNRKHDERLGQRLYNELRKDIPKPIDNGIADNVGMWAEIQHLTEKHIVADKLWNMTDKEFIAYLERFFE